MRKKLQSERNQKMNELRKKIKELQEEKIEEEIEEIESTKDDSTRMYKAVRKIHRNKQKEEILVVWQRFCEPARLRIAYCLWMCACVFRVLSATSN